jgi:hypothetical protein
MIDPHLTGEISVGAVGAARVESLKKPIKADVRLFDSGLDIRLYVEGYEVGSLVVEVIDDMLRVWVWDKEDIIDQPGLALDLFNLNDDPRHSTEISEVEGE